MREQPKSILDKFCIDFCKVIEKYCKYIIVSGFVAISSGRVRGTEDIDMIIERLTKDNFKPLHKGLIKNNFVCMQSDSIEEIFSYLDEGMAVRYTLRDKPLPEMEIKFAKDMLAEMRKHYSGQIGVGVVVEMMDQVEQAKIHNKAHAADH